MPLCPCIRRNLRIPWHLFGPISQGGHCISGKALNPMPKAQATRSEPSGSEAGRYLLGCPFKFQLWRPKRGLHVQGGGRAPPPSQKINKRRFFSILSPWIFEIQ